MHSDEDQIRRRADDTADEPGSDGANALLSETELASFRLLPAVEEFVVNTQTGGGVEKLTGQGGVQTSVEAFEAVLLETVLQDSHG